MQHARGGFQARDPHDVDLRLGSVEGDADVACGQIEDGAHEVGAGSVDAGDRGDPRLLRSKELAALRHPGEGVVSMTLMPFSSAKASAKGFPDAVQCGLSRPAPRRASGPGRGPASASRRPAPRGGSRDRRSWERAPARLVVFQYRYWLPAESWTVCSLIDRRVLSKRLLRRKPGPRPAIAWPRSVSVTT